jgi:hypothetical protein
MTTDPVDRFARALPRVWSWVGDLLATHRSNGVAVSALGYQRLPGYFSGDSLDRARVIVVRTVPVPPLSALGLPELSGFERMPMAGITFGDTLFLTRATLTESTCFHELVHVGQWDALGTDGFLLAYAVCLLRHGYDRNPFEELAHRLQRRFDRGESIPGMAGIIETHARTIGASLLAAPGTLRRRPASR